jgi:hypothetical protein
MGTACEAVLWAMNSRRFDILGSTIKYHEELFTEEQQKVQRRQDGRFGEQR